MLFALSETFNCLMRSVSVETCIELCGLEPYRNAAVGSLGIENRKRTTIGVELAAKVSTEFILAVRHRFNNDLSPNFYSFWMNLPPD